MTTLETILDYKRKEVEDKKSLYPVKLLERSIYFPTTPVSLKEYLLRPDKSGIIAEFKRSSPSKGMINEYASVEKTSIGYMQAGASALSVLTDDRFFGGSNGDLTTARQYNYCPVLRKDFIIDEYQIIEAKSIGADAILLIAAALDSERVAQLAELAHSLGLEVVLELHQQDELDCLCEHVDVVGVNNRDLKDFSVRISRSIELFPLIPSDFVRISESGIHRAETVAQLRDVGFQGFLIGGFFMEASRPEQRCRQFIDQVRGLTGRAIGKAV